MRIHALQRRLDRLRERLHVKNTRLPTRFYNESGELVYETPGYQDQTRVTWKVYIGLDPDEDGIEP